MEHRGCEGVSVLHSMAWPQHVYVLRTYQKQDGVSCNVKPFPWSLHMQVGVANFHDTYFTNASTSVFVLSSFYGYATHASKRCHKLPGKTDFLMVFLVMDLLRQSV